MVIQIRKCLRLLAISVALAILFLSLENYIPGAKFINLKIYDLLNRIEYSLKKPPAEIKDIVIVSIDNETVSKMPYRWPYPRSLFAKVIQNLTLSHAKVIAFDFVFLGKSEEAEDKALEDALKNNNRIILASTIDEGGSLSIHSLPRLSGNVPSGIVTKLQDSDGAIRRNLTYLISDEIPPKGFLSWEMAIMKMTEGLSLTPVKGDECYISIKDDLHGKWMIPVDCYNKSFMINFRARTEDFTHISFYNAYKGDFNPDVVKDKLVLIGFVSSLLGDIHNTLASDEVACAGGRFCANTLSGDDKTIINTAMIIGISIIFFIFMKYTLQYIISQYNHWLFLSAITKASSKRSTPRSNSFSVI